MRRVDDLQVREPRALRLHLGGPRWHGVMSFSRLSQDGDTSARGTGAAHVRPRYWSLISFLNVRLTTLRLFSLLAAVQLVFTFTIRTILVPRLMSAAHWGYGLVRDSDSVAFHQEAVVLSAGLREYGVRALLSDQFESVRHTKFIALAYWLGGSDWPGWVYLCNALIFAANGVILSAILKTQGMRQKRALVWSLVLVMGPMHVFSYSELLREPFVISGVLLFVWGLLALTVGGGPRSGALRQSLVPAFAVGLGFFTASAFRPYLQLMLFLVAGAVATVAFARRLARPAGLLPTAGQYVALAAVLVALSYMSFSTRFGRAYQYSDSSIVTATAAPIVATGAENVGEAATPAFDPEAWRRSWLAVRESGREFSRSDWLVPHACSVQWAASTWLPGTLDRKLEALACSREDYLRFCNQGLLGTRADRYCDEVMFTRAADMVAHVPRAAALGLLMPLPRMWFDGLGSGGTGLRRLGYLIDGVLSYALLIGLLFLGRTSLEVRYQAVAMACALVMVVCIFELAVPSQFILARLRLAVYLPLLALGAVGWSEGRPIQACRRLFNASR